MSAENRSQELANCVSTPLIFQHFPGLRPWTLLGESPPPPQTPSSIGRAPFMRYVHKGCSQVLLTAHIVHEWINVAEISRISIFQSWQLCLIRNYRLHLLDQYHDLIVRQQSSYLNNIIHNINVMDEFISNFTISWMNLSPTTAFVYKLRRTPLSSAEKGLKCYSIHFAKVSIFAFCFFVFGELML